MGRKYDAAFTLITPYSKGMTPDMADMLNQSIQMDGNIREEKTLKETLASQEWAEYFNSLASTINFEFTVYGDDGSRLFITRERPFCTFIKAGLSDSTDCLDSCHKKMFESLTPEKPAIYRCQAKLINFAFSVERPGEKAFVVGTGDYATYDDLLELLKIVRDKNLPEIPVTMPLHFLGEDYVLAIARYVHLTIVRMLGTVEEQHKLEEKLLRMTSLFDSQTFGTLSKNPELMHRYILDTIEFIFGQTLAVFMVRDRQLSKYRAVNCTGRYRDEIMDFCLDADAPLVHKMLNYRSSVLSQDMEEMAPSFPLKEIKSGHFFPLFIGGDLEGVIGIFDRKLFKEDVKIINAFRDYVQLNLENRNLRDQASKSKKADQRLSNLVELSKSIVSILDTERLLNTLLAKSLQLLNAEQGSVMLVDQDTSELVVEAKKSVDDTVREKMRFKKGEGISGRVIESGGSMLVEDIESDPRTMQANRPRYKTKSFVSVPIKIDDRVTGLLNISDKTEGNAFDEDDLNLLESFINNVAIAIERSLLYDQTEALQKLSITDHLTGIYNRRYLNRRLSEEITRYNRYKHPFSFMMLDLDKFKEYNDTFGHISGDNLIKVLATIIEKSLRTIDIAARFGGDEFVAIFPQTPKVDAIQITNRLKEKIDRALSQHNIEMPLSVSVGLATYPDDASSIMELIEKTDQALYLAKKGGGNRVVYL